MTRITQNKPESGLMELLVRELMNLNLIKGVQFAEESSGAGKFRALILTTTDEMKPLLNQHRKIRTFRADGAINWARSMGFSEVSFSLSSDDKKKGTN